MAHYSPTTATTTRGGCAFEELCNGSIQSYACDNLIDITKTKDGRVPTIDVAVQMISEHLDRCVRSIETERECELEYFYIGKTHVRKRANTKFNHMDRNTWKLDNGINQRFRVHKDSDDGYGRDGLVVLTVVTREAIDPYLIHVKHQEEYALELEYRLIKKYKKSDSRLYNKTLEPGRRDRTPSIGYPLYMAFKVYPIMHVQ